MLYRRKTDSAPNTSAAWIETVIREQHMTRADAAQEVNEMIADGRLIPSEPFDHRPVVSVDRAVIYAH